MAVLLSLYLSDTKSQYWKRLDPILDFIKTKNMIKKKKQETEISHTDKNIYKQHCSEMKANEIRKAQTEPVMSSSVAGLMLVYVKSNQPLLHIKPFNRS